MEYDIPEMTNEVQTDSSSPTNMSLMAFNNLTSSTTSEILIPNSVYVGGIDFKTDENELRKLFTQYGSVKDVRIVTDRTGASKGYGFITFETQEDAQKILQETKILNYKGRKLDVRPARRKPQIRQQSSSVMPEASTRNLTTSSECPYIYHNGVAYFYTPEVATVPQPWPSRAVSGSPVTVAQLVYQSPTYHYQAPTQCLPTQLQWSVPQSPPASSPSFLYLQPSEVVYQPVGITQEGMEVTVHGKKFFTTVVCLKL
ncbi:protein boule-like [Cuculus canorus]|uniref:protein boule-like n=1 Tax=Cuculus canorus TaxID=55661 RepID=UPI0023AA98B7|nr:protein boule-like [Cuculus canorus]